MGAMRTCPCAECGTQVFKDFSTTLIWSTNAMRFSLSGRLIHSYPSNHSGRIFWVGIYQLKNYPLGNSARHRATHSFASTLSQFSLVFFSLSGLLKSYVLGPVPGTGVTGQWGCQGPALSGSMGQVLMRHCGPKDAVEC